MPELLHIGIFTVIGIVIAVVFFFLGITYRKKVSEREIQSAEEKAKRIINDSIKGAEQKKREALLEAKEEIHKNRSEHEREIKERRTEIQKQERRLQQKEEMLDKKTDILEKKTETVEKKRVDLETAHEEINHVKRSQFEMLEKISGYTVGEAKAYLIANLESEVTHEAAMKIREIEDRLKEEADQKAREYISQAIQRCAADHVAEATVSVVPLPNDEMKGRIIGREGRNIRAIETLTGVDLIIDDTPEAVVISCFDTVRREIAKTSMESSSLTGASIRPESKRSLAR